MYLHIHEQHSSFYQISIKPEFSRQTFEKYSNMKFHENPSIGRRVVHADGRRGRQTDMTKLIVTFRNFANAHNTNLKEIIADWIQVEQDSLVAGWYEYESEISTSTDMWTFLSCWLKYKLIKKILMNSVWIYVFKKFRIDGSF
jgi:hypothetical protein